MTKKKQDDSFDFEKGMERLDEIIAGFDEGGLSLDDMEKYFTEGMELIQKCTHRLDEFETKVSKLLDQFQEDFQHSPLADVSNEIDEDEQDELV